MHLLKEDLDLARTLVNSASDMALNYLAEGLQRQIKPDGSIVTNADREIEHYLLAQIHGARPDDAVHGEEFGRIGQANRCWFIDPIDGTSNYVTGQPEWGPQIALQIDDEIVIGVISRPAQSTYWWAARGHGAHKEDRNAGSVVAISTSSESDLGASKVVVWEDESRELSQRLESHTKVISGNMNAILEVAEGKIEAAIDTNGKPWDHAPYTILVSEAGGQFSDHQGGQRIDIGEVRYTNAAIHDVIVELIGKQ